MKITPYLKKNNQLITRRRIRNIVQSIKSLCISWMQGNKTPKGIINGKMRNQEIEY